MIQVIFYCAFVLPLGWGLSFLLAREVKKKGEISSFAIVYSLTAVSVPALMAFALSSSAERIALLAQFNFRFSINQWCFAVAAPLAISVAGHLGGIYGKFDRSIDYLPSFASLKAGLGFLPICFIWGLLEEIGWRGFLVPRMTTLCPTAPVAVATVGLIWGLWHAPQMFFSDLPGDGAWKERPFTGAILWIFQCVALGCILGWLQLKTGSFFLPTLAHALINFFGRVSEPSFSGKADPVWVGASGLAGIAVSVCIVGVLLAFGVGG